MLETNPNGTWRGWCRGRVGTFKFLNVETIPRPLPGPQVAPVQGGQGGQVKAGSVQELLTSLGLGHFLSVFILNGHDTLASLRTLDTRQLEYFGIMDPSKQTQLLAAVQVTLLKELYNQIPEFFLYSQFNHITSIQWRGTLGASVWAQKQAQNLVSVRSCMEVIWDTNLEDKMKDTLEAAD